MSGLFFLEKELKIDLCLFFINKIKNATVWVQR